MLLPAIAFRSTHTNPDKKSSKEKAATTAVALPLSTIVPTASLEQGYRAGTDRNAKAEKAFSTLPAILFPDRV
jgi:hypothetical protein